jgi:hypothetical protein
MLALCSSVATAQVERNGRGQYIDLEYPNAGFFSWSLYGSYQPSNTLRLRDYDIPVRVTINPAYANNSFLYYYYRGSDYFIYEYPTDADRIDAQVPGFTVGSISSRQFTDSNAVDIVNVVWLGSERDAPQQLNGVLSPYRAAESLQYADLQTTGTGYAAIGPLQEIDSDLQNVSPDIDPIGPAIRENGTGLLYGVRMIRARNSESTHISRAFLFGDISWKNELSNDILGPVVGIVWARTYQRWSVDLRGLLMAGYSYGRIKQSGSVGVELVPGALNRPLFAQPAIEYGNEESIHALTPCTEIRAESTYELSNALALRFGVSSVLIENVAISQGHVIYGFPMVSQRDPGMQQLFAHTLYCGIEFVR